MDEGRGQGFLLPVSSFRRHGTKDAGVLSTLQLLVFHIVEWVDLLPEWPYSLNSHFRSTRKVSLRGYLQVTDLGTGSSGTQELQL